jgi:LacI family transcriptional regulator
MSKVTLKDIASELKLSIPTVSRALGGFSDIAEETRKKVAEKARSMGYRPNTNARNLVNRKAPSENILILGVGNVLRSIAFNSYYAEIMRSFCDFSEKTPYRLVLSSDNSTDPQFADYHDFLEGHNTAGAVILDIEVDDDRTGLLRQSGIPFVVLGEYEPEGPEEYAAWTDNFAGAYTATKHLLDKGCRKIGLITGLPGQKVTASRCLGYRHALEEATLEYDADLVIEASGMDERGGFEAMRELLQRTTEFDGIFCASDLRSIGVIKALRDSGYRVPDDIPVIGYDDLTLGAFFEPALTTIHQPTYELGWHAIETLNQLIRGDYQGPNKRVYQPELIIRESA